MSWFNKNSEEQKNGANRANRMPEDNNCADNYGAQCDWMGFCLSYSYYIPHAVKFELLALDFYKITLDSGDVIFFTGHEGSIRQLTAEEAKFATLDEWLREFGRRLLYLMDSRNMKQSELADASGLSQASISSYLSHKKVPSAFVVRCLANTLSVPIEFLANY